MSNSYSFQVGDLVTKLYGKKPAQIVSVYGSGDYRRLHCKYYPTGGSFTEYAYNLKPYQNAEETMSDQKQLYSFKKEDGTVGYGTHIGTNSSNQYLIEEKGTGAIHVFDKKNLEEVLPYTFSATLGGKENHYVGEPDKLKKGDVLLYTGSTTPQVAVVTGVDTKNKAARSKFKGVKISTEEI